MKRLTFTLFLILIVLLPGLAVKKSVAQDKATPFYFGVFGAGAYNMHSGTLGTTEGIYNCGTFQDATSLRWAAGNYLEFPIFERTMLSLRLSYHVAGADFQTLNPISPDISLNDGTLVREQTQQTLSTTVDYIDLSIIGKYFIYKDFYGMFGPVIGFNTRAAYNQSEQILSPQGLTFINGESNIDLISGTFGSSGTGQQRQLRIAAQIGVGLDYPLSDRFVLNPEISYQYSFLDVFTPSNWKINSLFAGVGLKVLIGVQEKVIKAPTVEPPVEQKIQPIASLPSPVASLQAFNLMKDGSELNYSEISVADEVSSTVMPLLPYIFFATDDGKIDARYNSLSPGETGSFDERNFRDPIQLYHNLLNIVGKRMNQYPESKITITGCTEPLDDTANSGELSRQRANSLKDYLVSAWSISPDRITIKTRQLPEVISNRQSPDGRQENRRAEISSDDSRILAPVKCQFTQTNISPEAIVFKPTVQFPEYVKKWNLQVEDIGKNELFAQNNNGAPENRIVWNYDRDKLADIARSSGLNRNVTADFQVTGDSEKASNSTAAIPVRYSYSSKLLDGRVVNDTIVERYVLLFFDFDKPKISTFNENVVSLIQSRIRTNSVVKVMGYTDRMGPEARNKELSENRADATADAIKTRIVPEKLVSEGKGPTLIYDNDLPEGRMYNRTVIVEVYTPIEK